MALYPDDKHKASVEKEFSMNASEDEIYAIVQQLLRDRMHIEGERSIGTSRYLMRAPSFLRQVLFGGDNIRSTNF